MILILNDYQLKIIKESITTTLKNVNEETLPDELAEIKNVLKIVESAMKRKRPNYTKGKEL